MTTFIFVDESDVLKTTTSTSLFARALVHEWCLGQMKFINTDVLRHEIQKLLEDFESNYDDFKSTVDQIQSLLMVVRPELTTLDINVEWRPKSGGRMSASICNMSAELATLIGDFSVRRRATMRD